MKEEDERKKIEEGGREDERGCGERDVRGRNGSL
jgi:hypothetical protein